MTVCPLAFCHCEIGDAQRLAWTRLNMVAEQGSGKDSLEYRQAWDEWVDASQERKKRCRCVEPRGRLYGNSDRGTG